MVEAVYYMIKSFSKCFKCISLAFTLGVHLYRFICGNLVGRLIISNWVLGRFTRFYDPEPKLQNMIFEAHKNKVESKR